MEIETPYGPALAEVDEVPDPRLLLVLTHGSAGGVDAPDLVAVRDAVLEIGGTVARVVQPFRMRGARAPGSAAKQDEAWLAVVAALRERHPGLTLVQGGRSNGARVACRTARAAGAAGVIALAFPLHPPGRPERSRAEELRQAGTPVLVINGDRDPFGVPDEADAERLVILPGEAHDLKKDPARVGAEAARWLLGLREPLRLPGERP
ncbi:alpha/beta hydrolase [Sphaerimonospora thailandensis]|uniref:Alpha/beta hydrolase n=1 Tax=Sphaerimonospora thailandensis TaxID=795644 RepID=A0A8J3VY31_9ACTN|nr:alpha/beta family hydrolase [Sphaerimonospora thailandensis]GIH68536.1 alpha/beta hydrolase [Sphaerimonospora thailandensis]